MSKIQENRSLTVSITQKANLYERYLKLSEEYQFSETFDSYDNNKIKEIYEKSGYRPHYNKKEDFFGIEEILKELKFNLNIKFKYGNVEIHMISIHSNIGVGHVFSLICKYYEMAKGIEREGYIKDPKFRTYEELEEILKEVFAMYEDFKKECIRAYENGEFDKIE